MENAIALEAFADSFLTGLLTDSQVKTNWMDKVLPRTQPEPSSPRNDEIVGPSENDFESCLNCERDSADDTDAVYKGVEDNESTLSQNEPKQHRSNRSKKEPPADLGQVSIEWNPKHGKSNAILFDINLNQSNRDALGTMDPAQTLPSTTPVIDATRLSYRFIQGQPGMESASKAIELNPSVNRQQPLENTADRQVGIDGSSEDLKKYVVQTEMGGPELAEMSKPLEPSSRRTETQPIRSEVERELLKLAGRSLENSRQYGSDPGNSSRSKTEGKSALNKTVHDSKQGTDPLALPKIPQEQPTDSSKQFAPLGQEVDLNSRLRAARSTKSTDNVSLEFGSQQPVFAMLEAIEPGRSEESFFTGQDLGHHRDANSDIVQDPVQITSGVRTDFFNILEQSTHPSSAGMEQLENIGNNESVFTQAGVFELSNLQTTEIGIKVIEQLVAPFSQMESMSLPSGEREFSIQIHPEELGRLEVKVTGTEDGMSAQIFATEFITSELLNREKDHLIEALNEKGIAFPNLDISHRQSSDQNGTDSKYSRFDEGFESIESGESVARAATKQISSRSLVDLLV